MDFAWFSTWTADGVTAVGTMLQGIFVGAATVGGFLAFNNWKREQIGRRKMEVAEEALALMYEVQDAFRLIRSRHISRAEAVTIGEETVADFERGDSLLFYRMPLKRIEKYYELFQRAYSFRPKVRVLLGISASAQLSSLLKVRKDVEDSAEMLLSMMKLLQDRVTDRDEADMRQFLSELRADVLASANEENDPIMKKVNHAVKEMERITRPHLK
jgi:hypothetical protein